MNDNRPPPELLKRLHYLQGQLNGLEKMYRENRPPADIYVQLLAVEGGIKKLIHTHYADHLRQQIAALLSALLQTSQPPETLAILEEIRNNFPHYSLKELPKVLQQLQQLARQ